jgi:hypothetical protein
MFKIMTALYTVGKTDEELVRYSIACIDRETDRSIGFGR